MKPGEAVDFKSSWTTNIYTGPGMTVTYSVLSPLSVIDLKTNALSAEISGLKNSAKPRRRLVRPGLKRPSVSLCDEPEN